MEAACTYKYKIVAHLASDTSFRKLMASGGHLSWVHMDVDFVHYLVSSLRDGFDVGLSGKLSSTVRRNRPSALANPKVVNK